MNILVEAHIELDRCEVHPNVKIGYRTKAAETTINSFTTIGRYCSIGRRCTLNAVRHPTTEIEPRLIIGNDVTIGDDVVIMSGVTIGDGAAIATRSVVTDDVEPYQMVAGSPAKHQQYRFEPLVAAQLQALEWWRYEEDFIRTLPHEDVIATMQLLLATTATAREEQTLRPHHREWNLPPLSHDLERVRAFSEQLK